MLLKNYSVVLKLMGRTGKDMDNTKPIIKYLDVLIILLLLIVTILGVCSFHTSFSYEFVNQYGQKVQMWGAGIYAHDSYFKAPIFIGSDFTILLFVVPLSIVTFFKAKKKQSVEYDIRSFGIVSLLLYYSASPEISGIFSCLFEVPQKLLPSYYRIKMLELLLYLEQLKPSHVNRLTSYQSELTVLIREIHDFITADLSKRFTIEELSKKYLINTTTLKKIFKAVYEKPIAAYMKEYRIRQAMLLLSQTDDSMADIAGQVGYVNQGKFTQAFKEQTQMLPTEYRKRCRLRKMEKE